MSTRFGWTVGSVIAGGILAMTGFVANEVQTVTALNGLKVMMSIIPVALGVISLIILMFFYKLDEKTMAKIKAELDERRKAGGEGAATA
jgi:GPH family glycoside/pentoside/hexuronide:cation symporter